MILMIADIAERNSPLGKLRLPCSDGNQDVSVNWQLQGRSHSILSVRLHRYICLNCTFSMGLDAQMSALRMRPRSHTSPVGRHWSLRTLPLLPILDSRIYMIC